MDDNNIAWLRLEALKLALLEGQGETPEEVVAEAAKFFAFLSEDA